MSEYILIPAMQRVDMVVTSLENIYITSWVSELTSSMEVNLNSGYNALSFLLEAVFLYCPSLLEVSNTILPLKSIAAWRGKWGEGVM